MIKQKQTKKVNNRGRAYPTPVVRVGVGGKRRRRLESGGKLTK